MPTIRTMGDGADNAVCEQCQYPLRGLVVSRVTGVRTCPECGAVEVVERLLPERSPAFRNLVLFGPSGACSLLAMLGVAAASGPAVWLSVVGLVLSIPVVYFAVLSVLRRRVLAKDYKWRVFSLLVMGWAGSIGMFILALMLGSLIWRAVR
ncbi:MAG: hypothetical protein K2X32_14415 [Phycisphaerales bacterium]|nr:hypothetical protein [Phycisphaerales bacterium]